MEQYTVRAAGAWRENEILSCQLERVSSYDASRKLHSYHEQDAFGGIAHPCACPQSELALGHGLLATLWHDCVVQQVQRACKVLALHAVCVCVRSCVHVCVPARECPPQ